MDLKRLKKIIDGSHNIVFFGGAGVSTASGIPDFRSAKGLYGEIASNGFPPEYMLSHTCFINHTQAFFDFYKRKMIHPDAKPNAAHNTLCRLEKQGKLKAVITQNIDGLHQLAGSQNVLELHGSVYRNWCTKCGKRYGLNDIVSSETVPKCKACGGIVKPDVVLYEESLDLTVIDAAVRRISEADVLIVGGTSLSVYPAAGLVEHYRGGKLVLINKTKTPYDGNAALVVYGDIAEVLGAI